jgi:hypothetical protein
MDLPRQAGLLWNGAVHQLTNLNFRKYFGRPVKFAGSSAAVAATDLQSLLIVIDKLPVTSGSGKSCLEQVH